MSTNFTMDTTSAANSNFSLGATPASTTGFSLGTQAPSTSSLPDSQSSSPQPTNVQQLVDLINNFVVRLENQEKPFVNQSNEITVWENILTNRSTKLEKFYGILKYEAKKKFNIKQEQGFVLAQHKELDDCLVLLEQELKFAQVLSSLNNKRKPIYTAAHEINNQVKQISSDIEEIVNNLNNINSENDSDDDLDTICRILNCHMAAMQYIKHNAENLSVMVTEVNKEYMRLLSATERSFMLQP